MRIARIVLGAVALAALLLAAGHFSGALQPRDRRPGLWLRGERATGEPVACEPEQIALETRAPWWLPHSVTVVCALAGGRLYVPSVYFDGGGFPDARLWNRNVVRDPRVRVRIGDRIYALRAAHVTDPAEQQAALAAFAAKYPFWAELRAKPPGERPGVAFVRMEGR